MWELDQRGVDVIAISSEVAFGTVGLSASLPVLRGHGLKAVGVPTALLSCLPHYPSVHATPIGADFVAGALVDLDELGTSNEASTVMTGYFADAAQVEAVADWLEDLLTRRPGLRVIVDPTLGDDDVGSYTDPALATTIRDRLVPLATGLVPNRFELGLMLGLPPRALAPQTTDAARLTERASSPPEASSTPALRDRALANAVRPLFGARTEWVLATGGGEGEDAIITPDRVTRIAYDPVVTGAKGAGDVMAAELVCALQDGLALPDAVRRAGDGVRRRLVAQRSD